MIQLLFAVYDAKAQCYKHPVFTRSIGEAMRAFSVAANDKESEIGKFPTEFSLVELGSYDDNTGEVKGLSIPTNHGLAAGYKEVKHE